MEVSGDGGVVMVGGSDYGDQSHGRRSELLRVLFHAGWRCSDGGTGSASLKNGKERWNVDCDTVTVTLACR